MKVGRLLIPAAIGAGLVLIVLVLTIGADGPDRGRDHLSDGHAGIAALGEATIREMDLASDGGAYEVNPDADGNLWVSDLEADEIWQVNWSSGTYTIYQGLPAPADGRRDTAGDVWWAAFEDKWLGRLSVQSGTVITWTIPGAKYLWGTAFDDTGGVWVTDSFAPRVYRFDPTITEVCTYTYDGGYSNYVVIRGGVLWLGDRSDHQLVRLDPETNQFTHWQLDGARPRGLAVDTDGNLWWADDGLSALGRLDPTSNVVTTYTLPIGASPTMIALSGGSVWYSEVWSDSFGLLDPAVATGISTTLIPTSTSVVSVCTALGAGTVSAATTSSDTIDWSAGTVVPAFDSDGWRVYELPSGAYPWGIAGSKGVWIVDHDRKKLIWHLYGLYLPLLFG